MESKAIENELKQADAWKKLFDKECERNKDKSARCGSCMLYETVRRRRLTIAGSGYSSWSGFIVR